MSKGGIILAYKDLRDFLEELDDLGELVRVKREITSGHEIFTILWELNNMEGPAVVFENVAGYDVPIVANLFGTMDRFAMACGFPRGKSPKEYKELFTERLDKKWWVKPKLVSDGPCKEVVLKGDDVNLHKFPVLQWHPGDGGKYVTLPLVITKDPRFGVNVGIYRMMIHDERSTGIMCNIFQDIGIHFGRAMKAGSDKMECAVAIGADPAIYEAAVTKIPTAESEFEFAGALRGGEPVELVKCETVDLEVPAGAEIVLEGEISINERRLEGPYGEWMGYFEEPMMLPVFNVKCITHRKNPLYPMTTEGHFHGDGENIRIVPQISTFARSAKAVVTGFVDAWLPHTGRGYMAVVSIKKRYPGWGKQAIYQLLSLPYVATAVNFIVVVDDDIDPSDSEAVTWALSTRVDPALDVVITPAIGVYPLNPAARSRAVEFEGTRATDVAVCSKIGIDATLKTQEEGGRTRPSSIPVKPLEDMLEKVRREWKEYGFAK